MNGPLAELPPAGRARAELSTYSTGLSTWLVGWWRSDGILGCVKCRPGNLIAEGKPLRLGPLAGEVYCEDHGRTR